MGEAEDTRFQSQNRKLAFERMADTKEFKSWLQLKIDASMGKVEIEESTAQGNRMTRKLRGDEV
jgi:hypothetical protein